MKNYFDNIIYVSYLTVQPTKDEIHNYINEVSTKIIDDNSQIWFLGRMTEFIDAKSLTNKIFVFNSISDLVQEL
jgi:hypothetical protein